MIRLSSPFENMQPHYDVVVIGSGYGGGIAASRMARAGKSVCLLERGKEFQPGEYPDTQPEAAREMQFRLPDCDLGSSTGLYDFVVGPDINVFLGCGLGGTSLVNANVSIEPEPRVFADARWPAEIRASLETTVKDGYSRAREMLKPNPYPDAFPALPKLQALEQSAAFLEQKFYRTDINVTFEDKVNHVGVQQHTCTMCGDCVTGCNAGAKNTTLMNYLPDAVNHGAQIYTCAAVRYLERSGDKWIVHYEPRGDGREAFDAPDLFVSADTVFVAAGTLGSTEILLRSKAQGLPLSDQVGARFSGNGDVLGFSYDSAEVVNGIGFGHRAPGVIPPVGPCITGIVDMRYQPVLDDGMIIEEGSIPGALADALPATFAVCAKELGKDTDAKVADLIEQKAREVESLIGGAYRGAVKDTQTYLVMTHDTGDGRMRLENDRLQVDWPGVGREEIFRKVNDNLLDATVPLDGTYIRNPIWTKQFHKDLVTVHPLGGCVMSADASTGVVNHKSQVFLSNSGTQTYNNLYVCDGSVIPRPLGVNPLLTISAMAERACALAAQDRGWIIDYSLPSAPEQIPAQAAVGIQFTETMRGWWDRPPACPPCSTETASTVDPTPVAQASRPALPEALDPTPAYLTAESAGKAANSTFEFTLTIASPNLEDMLSDPAHRAPMAGTAIAPSLSARPMTAEGEFQLFVDDPTNVQTRNMIYRMKLVSEEGKTYFFRGFKVVRPNSPLDIWHDTSTLYITLYNGADETAPPLGLGILHILPQDFLKQMTTMQAANATSVQERLAAIAKFGQFFAGTLYDTYGSVFARSVDFNPDAPPRKKRPLRVSAPEVYDFAASDGVPLRLTRYRGGSKGPVILSHGLGVSSLIFSIDTIDVNLLEYLFAHGYDVWLFDCRASIALSSSKLMASGDDIATKDYPAAVDKVRQLTGAPSVQMVVHCWGSTTFFMAMLAGLTGVRSAVASQIATNFITPVATKIKTGLHVPSFLDALGVKSLTAYVDTHADWQERLYDAALKLYPVGLTEECRSDVCHRISFMYAPLYQHEQLNEATHNVLHEMFGVANMRAFEHLALLANAGHSVAADGAEVYMSHFDRLAIPIAFVHGGSNRCFLPESTELTLSLLRQANGDSLYSRHVIPGYGHIDCIFGKNAVTDVYPFILSHLELSAEAPSTNAASHS